MFFNECSTVSLITVTELRSRTTTFGMRRRGWGRDEIGTEAEERRKGWREGVKRERESGRRRREVVGGGGREGGICGRKMEPLLVFFKG